MKKQELKISFFNRFENKKLYSLEININELTWETKGKELIINNHLFDIKTISYKNNKAIITGWYDGDEDDINTAINNHNDNSKKEKNTYPFFSYIFCEPVTNFNIEHFAQIQNKKYYFKNIYPYEVAIQILAPPPRV